jgi:hypothetical protein
MILTEIYDYLLSQFTFSKGPAGMSGIFMGLGGRIPLAQAEDFTGVSSMPKVRATIKPLIPAPI